MDTHKKDRPGWHREAALENPNVGHDFTPRRKWARILASFLTGRSWHALEASRDLHTVCLHSDVCGLERRGLRFARERITVRGYGGAPASVVSYRLALESYPLARDLLGVATPQSPHDDDARAYMLASRGTRGAP